jgi:hypothetical protein
MTASTARPRTAGEAAATALPAAGITRVATWLAFAALAALLALGLVARVLAVTLPRAVLLVLAAVTTIFVATAVISRLSVALAVAAL